MAQSQAILDCTTAKKQHGAQLPETFKNQEEEEEEKEGEEEVEEEEEEDEGEEEDVEVAQVEKTQAGLLLLPTP